MTQLTNQDPNATYGDLLTTTNNGNGLSTTLQQVQDGFGNSSTMRIATNAVNFDRTSGSFQLDGIALTATSTNINAVCGNTPTFNGNFPIRLPSGTTAQRPVAPQNGMIWYNTTLNAVEAYANGSWVTIT